MHGHVDQVRVRPRLGHPLDRCGAAVRGPVVHDPEHPVRAGVRAQRSSAVRQAGRTAPSRSCAHAGRSPARGEHPRRPGGPGHRRAFSRAGPASRGPCPEARWGGSGSGPRSRSSHLRRSRSRCCPMARRPRSLRTGQARAAFTARSGSRMEIHDRCCQGVRASPANHRPTVDAETATWQRAASSRASSGQRNGLGLQGGGRISPRPRVCARQPFMSVRTSDTGRSPGMAPRRP